MSETERLKQAWQTLRDEQMRLELDIQRIREQLEAKVKRLRELAGEWGAGSLVNQAHAAWQQAVKADADSGLPRVVWLQHPTDYAGRPAPEQVVERVTPKRLFIRPVGRPHCTQYDRTTGKRVGTWDTRYHGIIDVAKTLGE